MRNPAAFTIVLAAASVAAAFLHNAPGCRPDEAATVFSESVFPVVLPAPPVTGQIANLTLTAYTCPSRQTSAARLGTGKRQNARPIDVCGIMDSSAVFASAFNCTQSQGTLPTLKDCTDFATLVIDNFIRTLDVTIPARSGLAASLPNNSCAFVFLNDDDTDDYDTCFHTISDMNFDIQEECPQPLHDGFIGSVRSPIQPGVQNWEVRIVDSSFLEDPTGTPAQPSGLS